MYEEMSEWLKQILLDVWFPKAKQYPHAWREITIPDIERTQFNLQQRPADYVPHLLFTAPCVCPSHMTSCLRLEGPQMSFGDLDRQEFIWVESLTTLWSDHHILLVCKLFLQSGFTPIPTYTENWQVHPVGRRPDLSRDAVTGSGPSRHAQRRAALAAARAHIERMERSETTSNLPLVGGRAIRIKPSPEEEEGAET